jgi:hypothetical protein
MVWSTSAPYAYRTYHVDSDPALNGLAWEGIQLQQGIGWDGLTQSFTMLNAQLIGAPVHDPAHPVFLKYGIKADVLDSPNPFESQFLYDEETYAQTTDFLNNLATDDTTFNGLLPWMATLPSQTAVAAGATFPADGSTCVPDFPATQCSYLAMTLRPDLSFAASLDGKIPSIPVTATDVAFSMLLARDDPISFISGSYLDLQNVIVTGTYSFTVEFRTNAVWNPVFAGGTPVVSMQHWCTEAHIGGWPGTTSSSNCFPIGWPSAPTDYCGGTPGTCAAGVPSANILASGALPPASTTSCNLDYGDYGFYSCPHPMSPQSPGDAQCTESTVAPTCYWPDYGVSVVSSGTQNSVSQTKQAPGAPVGVDLGSYAFVYDSQASFPNVNGPILFRTREGGMPLGSLYGGANSPQDGYFTNACSKVGTPTQSASCSVSGPNWDAFHNAGNVAWVPNNVQCWSSYTFGGPDPTTAPNAVCTNLQVYGGNEANCGPLPAPQMTINVIDLSLVASHLGSSPLLNNACWGDDSAPWDVSGPTPGTPDGQVNILDLSWVALHFGQTFLGGQGIPSIANTPLGAFCPTGQTCWMTQSYSDSS